MSFKAIYRTIFAYYCVNAVTTQAMYPLEFITQELASENGMIFGFQLLEEIRQTRIACEDRRDELEQQFTVELNNWIKYSRQTQQVMAKPDFENQYTSESRQIIENTIVNTYREIYSSRRRRLSVVEHQCNDALEELLQQRKRSMLALVADLIKHDINQLNALVSELVYYREQLHDGLQRCIESMQHGIKLSSKVLQPEEYCYSPDIEILTAFLNRMLDIIMEEQASFFDDEDLSFGTPCSVSGCGEIDDISDKEEDPTSIHTLSNLPASVTSHELPTRPTSPEQMQDDTQVSDTTSRPLVSTETTQKQTALPLITTPTAPETRLSGVTLETSPALTDPTTLDLTQVTSIEPQETGSISTGKMPETRPPLMDTTTDSIVHETENIITQEAIQPVASAGSSATEVERASTPPTIAASLDTVTPVWLNDAVEEVLNQQNQAQIQTTEDNDNEKAHTHEHGENGDDFEDDSESEHSTGHHGHNDNSGSHNITIDIPDEQKAGDSSSSKNIYHLLTYSFSTVGAVLFAATIVLVAAIIIVQYKRRQLLATQMITQEQKISIMKQTGYINPTYKFFDKQIDG